MEALITDRLASLVRVKRGSDCLGVGGDAARGGDAVRCACSASGGSSDGGASEVGDDVRCDGGEEGAREQALLRARRSLAQEPTHISGRREPVTSSALCDNHVMTNLPQHLLGHMTSDHSHSDSFNRVTWSTGLLQPSPLKDYVITSLSHPMLTKSHVTTSPAYISPTTSHMITDHTHISPSTRLTTGGLAQLNSPASLDHVTYTSPLLCPTLTTSPLLPDHTHTTISAYAVRVTGMHQFPDVCCVGVSMADYIQVTNPGERWLQVTFDVTITRMDGQQLSQDVFEFPERSYIEPKQTRLVKVMFQS